MIRRPLLSDGRVPLISADDGCSQFAVSDLVYFTDCHANQPDWIKQLFVCKGFVRQIYRRQDTGEVVYDIHFPFARCCKLIPEAELTTDNQPQFAPCPWGKIEGMIIDGIMLRIENSLAVKPMLDEIVRCLTREVTEYLNSRRRLHMILRTDNTNLKISFDQSAEFRLFGKRISYEEAITSFR